MPAVFSSCSSCLVLDSVCCFKNYPDWLDFFGQAPFKALHLDILHCFSMELPRAGSACPFFTSPHDKTRNSNFEHSHTGLVSFLHLAMMWWPEPLPGIMPYHGYQEIRFPLSGLLPEVVTTKGSTSEVFDPKRVEYRRYAANSIYIQPRDVRGKFWAVYCDVGAMSPIHMAKPGEKKKKKRRFIRTVQTNHQYSSFRNSFFVLLW